MIYGRHLPARHVTLVSRQPLGSGSAPSLVPRARAPHPYPQKYFTCRRHHKIGATYMRCDTRLCSERAHLPRPTDRARFFATFRAQQRTNRTYCTYRLETANWATSEARLAGMSESVSRTATDLTRCRYRCETDTPNGRRVPIGGEAKEREGSRAYRQRDDVERWKTRARRGQGHATSARFHRDARQHLSSVR